MIRGLDGSWKKVKQVEVDEEEKKQGSVKESIWKIVFEAETPFGRLFDVLLLLAIIISVGAVMLESVPSISAKHGELLFRVEWFFTILFTIEYIIRLSVVRHKWRYATSFFGIVDLLSCLPAYINILFPGYHSLIVIRALRLLRVFRVFKMVRHVNGADVLMKALYSGRAKITVFFFTVLMFVIISGTLMYLVEGRQNGFESIPDSVYWSIVTISTVGYGDVTPATVLGKIIASLSILIGYAIIAVPTGIVSSEITRMDGREDTMACHSCGSHGHRHDAKFCRRCGDKLT